MKRFLLALAAGLPLAGAAEAAPTYPPCSMEGVDWRNDPALRGRRVEALTCRNMEMFEPRAGDMHLRVLRAKVHQPTGEGEGIEQGVNLFTVMRLTAGGEQMLGRFLVPYDISRDDPLFDLRLARIAGGDPVLSLSRGGAVAYRLAAGGIVPFDAHAWVAGAREFAGAQSVAGAVRLVDFERMAGYLAVFPAGADDPARPGSVTADMRLVKAHLAFENGLPVMTRAERVDRGEIQDVEETVTIVETDEWMRKARRRLPAGTEPCDIAGWSLDTDPAGLNVRATPSAQGRVVGRVPPAWTSPGRDGDPGTSYRAEFKIAGYQNGWFLIRDIRAPGADYGETYPRARPQPYRGQGWVSARLVGGALANGGLRPGRLMQAPDPQAAAREVSRNGEPISTGDEVRRLLACSATWGLVEIEGARGWWKGICSNQVTNCS